VGSLLRGLQELCCVFPAKFCLGQMNHAVWKLIGGKLTDGGCHCIGSSSCHMNHSVIGAFQSSYYFHGEQAIESAPCKPKIWKRYVEDTFTILDRDRVGVSLQHLNSQQPSIRFTI